MHPVMLLALALPTAHELTTATVHHNRALATNHTGKAERRPPEHALRLSRGATIKEGTLQIYHDGKWGNICDDNWDMRDANVACRQLGFGEARDPIIKQRDFKDYYTYANWWEWEYNAEAGEPIWMDNVRCSGTEAKLADCAHSGWGVENCGHYEDVAIRCEGRALARTIEFSITFFCVSTAISIGALMIAALTLHRVWVMTRNHPRHAFAHVHELQQSGLVPMTYAPMATARVEFPARSESLKHVDASKEGDNESDRANLL